MQGDVLNFTLILVVLAVIITILVFRFVFAKKVEEKEAYEKEVFSYTNLFDFVKQDIANAINTNINNMGLGHDEMERNRRRLNTLREALRSCNTGDDASKRYVIDYIYDSLNNNFQFTEDNLNYVIPFNSPGQLTARDKFDICLFVLKRKHGKNALSKMIIEFDLAAPRETGGYYIEDKDINQVYKVYGKQITYDDKIKIIAERIYSHYKGFGIVDMIRDMNIDGVSGGVSGMPSKMENIDDDESFKLTLNKQKRKGLNCAWMMYKGKSIHLRFLEFEHEAELIRVVQVAYRYNFPGQLSESNPYIINEMFDGSRVTVACPPFAESWVYFIRKKFSSKSLEITQIVNQNNAELAIQLLIFLIKGNRTTAFTGAQGSGKTTLLIALIKYIHESLNLRIQETAFELNLRMIYNLRNILSFQETAKITGQMGMDFSKKTDGHVNILGEVATPPVASSMIQAGHLSLFTLLTHHAKTTDNLVFDIGNSLKKEGIYNDDRGAQQAVVQVLEFNVHLTQLYDGTRFIERITQIIPIEPVESDLQSRIAKDKGEKDELLLDLQIEYYKQNTQIKPFITRNIIEFKNGQYEVAQPITEEKQKEMLERMSEEEGQEFKEFMKLWGEEAC